jgi:hypothetical protein
MVAIATGIGDAIVLVDAAHLPMIEFMNLNFRADIRQEP